MIYQGDTIKLREHPGNYIYHLILEKEMTEPQGNLCGMVKTI